MSDALEVAVVDGLNDLFKYFSCILFFDEVLLIYMREEGFALYKFSHDGHFFSLVVVEYFIELQNIRMV